MGSHWRGPSAKVVVTQAQYEAGQHVSGEVYLNITNDIEFTKLTLEITGVEAVRFRNPLRGERPDGGLVVKKAVAKDRREIFRSFATLYEPPDGGLLKGKYRFPFLFVLPSELPGSASVAGADLDKCELGDYHAEVKYWVRAACENTYILVEDVFRRLRESQNSNAAPGADAAAGGAPTGAPAAAAEPPDADTAAAAAAARAGAVAAAAEKARPAGTAAAAEPPDAGAAAAAAPPIVAAAAGAAPTIAVADQHANGRPFADGGEPEEEKDSYVPPPTHTADGRLRFEIPLFDLAEIFILEPQQTEAPPHLVEQKIESKPLLLRCLKPQIVVAALWLNNTVVSDGDVFEVNVEFENPTRNSIHDVVLAFWRIITLKIPGMQPREMRSRLLFQAVTPVPGGYKFRREGALSIDFDIAIGLQQSVKTRFFDVSYRIALTGEYRKKEVDVEEEVILRKRVLSQTDHLLKLSPSFEWEFVEPATEVIRIQVEGAPAPDAENFDALKYVKVNEERGTFSLDLPPKPVEAKE